MGLRVRFKVFNGFGFWGVLAMGSIRTHLPQGGVKFSICTRSPKP